MGSQVLVALLVTVVLGDVVEVFTADDNGTVHLGGHDAASQDTATDGDLTDEGALLVCRVVSDSVPDWRGGLRSSIRLVFSSLETGHIGATDSTGSILLCIVSSPILNSRRRSHFPPPASPVVCTHLHPRKDQRTVDPASPT